jgi:hypothetical protein
VKRPNFGRFPNRAVQIPAAVLPIIEVLQPALILEAFGDRDIVICDDDLVKFNIDETTGEIIPQSSPKT